MKKVLLLLGIFLAGVIALGTSYLCSESGGRGYSAGTAPLFLMQSYFKLNTRLIAEPEHLSVTDKQQASSAPASVQAVPPTRMFLPVILDGWWK